MKSRALLCIALPALCIFAGSAGAAEEKKTGWSDQAKFSLVSTSGNSETSTFGFKNDLTHTWESAALKIQAGAIRAKSDTITRFAIGTVDDYSEEKDSASELTAESYLLNGKYGREISQKLFWFTGLGWERNRFAGIQNRYVVEGGVGNLWRDDEDLKFRTEYSVTYTDQEDENPTPGEDKTWIGARFGWTYLNKFGANTTYENELILDANLEEGSRWRGEMTNAVSVSMNSHLALRVGLKMLYENEPAFTDGELFSPGNPPTSTGTTVPVQLDNLDTIFTVSLVVDF